MSVEALSKNVQKPEKITLYSSYLPTNSKLEENKTVNDIDGTFDDEPFEFDDIESDNDEKPRENGFVYFIEIIASLAQLAWGAIIALFGPKTSS